MCCNVLKKVFSLDVTEERKYKKQKGGGRQVQIKYKEMEDVNKKNKKGTNETKIKNYRSRDVGEIAEWETVGLKRAISNSRVRGKRIIEA
jgi:hypothetical protein